MRDIVCRYILLSAFLDIGEMMHEIQEFLETNFEIENSFVSTLTPKIYFENIFFDESSDMMMTFINVLHIWRTHIVI